VRRGLPEAVHGLLWISPWVLGTIVFLAIPAGMAAYYSLTEYSLLEPPEFIGGANYAAMLHDRLFWISLRNTAVYAAACPLLGTVLSVLVAVLLEQGLRGTALVRAIVFVPTLIPIVSASIGWMWLYNGAHGLFNRALAGVGVAGPDWLGDPRWAMPSLIVMSGWVIGSAVTVCTASLREVPASLYEAAAMDGMGPWSRLRHVTIPMISPAILFNGVMSLIWGLQVFAVPLIMTRGGPENATRVFAMEVYSQAFEYGRMGYASALACVQFLITLVVAGGAFWVARRFVHYRAS
jgi:multiple sugar transport system permease protein